jgi:hypothetical protein
MASFAAIFYELGEFGQMVESGRLHPIANRRQSSAIRTLVAQSSREAFLALTVAAIHDQEITLLFHDTRRS